MTSYWQLFITFSKIGAFTFGGGYAMLPLIQKEIVEHHQWASEEDIMDYFAVAQCTPGVIAVNTATFIGYYQRGILGAIIATLGVITPSICIILTIASILTSFSEIAMVQHALNGIRIAVCILILQAVLKLLKSSVKDIFGTILFIAILSLSFLSALPTIFLVILSAVVGLGYSYIKKKGSSAL